MSAQLKFSIIFHFSLFPARSFQTTHLDIGCKKYIKWFVWKHTNFLCLPSSVFLPSRHRHDAAKWVKNKNKFFIIIMLIAVSSNTRVHVKFVAQAEDLEMRGWYHYFNSFRRLLPFARSRSKSRKMNDSENPRCCIVIVLVELLNESEVWFARENSVKLCAAHFGFMSQPERMMILSAYCYTLLMLLCSQWQPSILIQFTHLFISERSHKQTAEFAIHKKMDKQQIPAEIACKSIFSYHSPANLSNLSNFSSLLLSLHARTHLAACYH